MAVDVIIEAPRWAEADIEALAETAIDAALSHLGMDPDAWDISILACNDARIAALNASFRDKPKATNVLSWPSEERTPEVPPAGDPELGDISIAFDTCQDEAKRGGISLKFHTLHLLVHGTLHLLGYDHEEDADADLMEATETAILAKLGVPNPYER